MKIKALWELTRLEHGLMYGIGVVIGVVVSSGIAIEPQKLLFGILTAIFLQAAAFSLNDYCDYEVDLRNKRMDRPLVRGDLSRSHALAVAILLTPLGFIASVLISLEAFLLAFLITMAGFIYDLKLKEFGIAGNVYIAFSMAAPFIFGSVVALNSVTPAVAVLAGIAFLSGFAREIMKGIEDVEGDALRDVKTIARTKGTRIAAKYSAVIFILSVVLSPIPFLFLDKFIFDFKYLIPVLITDFILLKISFELLSGKFGIREIKKYRKESLVAMLFGLIGFLAGAF
ncbi:MAG: UbiA family prenyltransferase [Archaeoglobus sp.]|nr:UbiA family prenyltransferase [Archaeoglobus sp.]